MRPDRLIALVRHNTGLLLSQQGPLITRLIMPIAMIAALRPIYQAANGSSGTVNVVAGVLVLVSMLTTGMVGTSVLSERLWNTWDRLRTAASPLEIVVGKTAPLLVVLLVQQIAVLVFAVLVYDLPVRSLGLLAAAVLVWGCTILCIGFALGAVLKTAGALSAAQDIGSLLLSGLGGGLVPLAVMPGWLRTVAPVSPAYWAVSGLRGALGGDGSTVWVAVAVLAGCAGLAGLVAYRRLR